MKHRKLFPSLNSTNPTADCFDYCDPTTTETSFPDFYLPPPPPPPPPQSHQVSPYLILSASLLFCFLVLIIYYFVVHKSCFGWCRSRNRNERQLQSQSDDGDEEFLDENHHHPIWYIATVGLQQSIINSITICKYKKGDGLIEGTECSVCLNEFREDESLRLLPKCNHAFHISCIDTWLRSHVNCPMCRAQILCNNIIPTTSLNLGNSDLISETHEEDESEVNVGRNDENRGETEEDERGFLLKESENCNRNSLVMLNSSSARTICVGLDDFGLVHDNDDDEDEISSCGGNSEIQDDGNSNKVRGSSMAKCLHKSPILMKRSYSCSARFCSSKIKRNPNAILTL